jgi:hypothetical protein
MAQGLGFRVWDSGFGVEGLLIQPASLDHQPRPACYTSTHDTAIIDAAALDLG